jgi:5'-3' exonuclease
LSYKNQPVGAFFGYVKTILNLMDTYKPDNLIIACDSKEKTWRHKVYPEYKAGRTPADAEMIQQIPIINDWLNKVNQNNFIAPGFEADDIIFTIVVQSLLKNRVKPEQDHSHIPTEDSFEDLFATSILPKDGLKWLELAQREKTDNEILIFSADKDLYQLLVFEEVKFIKTSKFGLELFGSQEFKKRHELLPIQWVDYKALVGDPSDNLVGINGIGPKTATKFLQLHGSLFTYYQNLGFDAKDFIRSSFLVDGAHPSHVNQKGLDKFYPKIQDSVEQIRQVYSLASLQLVPDIRIISSAPDFSEGIKNLELFGFHSLLNKVKSSQSSQSQEALF